MSAFPIHYFPIPIMQYVLGGSLHKNNTGHLLMALYNASVNWISIVLMQIAPQNKLYYRICENSGRTGVLWNLKK